MMIKRIFLPSVIGILTAAFAVMPIKASYAAQSASFSITVKAISSSDSSSITTPATDKACSKQPTIVGAANLPNKEIVIKGKSGGHEVVVARAISDANGKFLAEIDSATPLDEGSNTITPYLMNTTGTSVTPIVKSNPTPEEEPQITSPKEGERVNGKRPTVSGVGKPDSVVKLYAKSGAITEVGSSTVMNNGIFSVKPSQDLSVGTNSIYVEVNGVASPAIEVVLIDPSGTVYDSQTNRPIEGAVVTMQRFVGGVWINCAPPFIAVTDLNPQTTATSGAYSFLAAVGGPYRLVVAKNGYIFPSGIIAVGAPQVGSHGEQFNVVAEPLTINMPMDFAGASLLKVEKDANKKNAAIGDVITYTVVIRNDGGQAVENVYLKDKPPPGFKYAGGKVLLDGQPISSTANTQIRIFNIGTVNANSSRTLKYQLVVGSGVSFGKHKNEAWCEFSNERAISNIAEKTVRVIPEPLFDLGTVIGKVFWDWNENGVQDPPKNGSVQFSETGVANVRIVMEDGTVILTDKDGKYHIPGIMAGRHAFRIDESTLPEGTYLSTPKVCIEDIRPGLTSKVNFGVVSSDGQKEKIPASIIRQKNLPEPRLNVVLNRDVLSVKDGEKLQDKTFFRIFSNYSLFIDKWNLEIFDKMEKKLLKKFEGAQKALTEPIIWDGKDEAGSIVKPDRTYTYILTVYDTKGNFDKTNEKEFKVIDSNKSNWDIGILEKKETEEQRWLRESKHNNLVSRNIRLEGETVLIKEAQEGVAVSVVKEGLPGGLPISCGEGANDTTGLESEIIIPKGQYEFIVEAKDKKGDVKKYVKHVKTGDDYCFFIAMGDGEGGYNFTSGNIEPIKDDYRFKKGLWVDGKLAYYLKAKIKGKYLIMSSLDTQRKTKELFRYIDPNKYYPIYGDTASISYEATNTQGMLYAMIEWDKSKLMWGDYNIEFHDTEFAQFTRTLYGGKAELISASSTKFGDPDTKIIGYLAKAQQKSAHDEFVGTGGSLFYFKNKYVIEGSDKVKIEIRDKITGLPLRTLAQTRGIDYQIDYDNGRIIFWRPVSQITASESIISANPLDGNQVYVIADYEYEAKDKYEEWSKGLRVSQQLGDHVRVGGTFIEDNQESQKNFKTNGVDATIKINQNIRFDAEYAETNATQGNNFISTDGGLTFAQLESNEFENGKAYGLSGVARVFDRLGITGYYKNIGKGFTATSVVANQGTEKTGMVAILDIIPGTQLNARYDLQKLLDNGNPQSRAQVGANKTETTTVQLNSAVTRKLDVTAEYRHQAASGQNDAFISETNQNADILAGRLGYKLTDRLKLLLGQQEALSGENNRQTMAGVETEINKYLKLKAIETVGAKGNATTIGIDSNLDDRFSIFADQTFGASMDGNDGKITTLGSKAKIDDNSYIYNSYSQVDSGIKGKGETVVFGSRKKLDNGYELSIGKEFSSQGKLFNMLNTYGVTREVNGRKIEGTFKEGIINGTDINSITNIFDLSGDINDKWAATFNLEKGKVQNLDGTRTSRIALAGGASYVDKDKIKASSKLEIRLDNNGQESRQILSYNTAQGNITKDLTLFGSANVSLSENFTINSTLGDFKEMVFGAAYRPVYCDRLNLIGKYSYLENEGPPSQSDIKNIESAKMHVFGLEAAYDLTDKIQVVEKEAYKYGSENVTGFGTTDSQKWLWINRLNYNITKDWQVSGEYRILGVVEAEDMRHGILVEISRRIGEFIRVGVGYNFTDFSDDLTRYDYTIQGPFIRLTGTLYDMTPQERGYLKEKRKKKNIAR